MKRVSTILASKDLGTTGTEVIEIRHKEHTSAIKLVFQFTVATVSVMLAPVLRCLSKIELVDGSDVIVSLTGEAAQGIAYIEEKKMPFNDLSLTVGGYCRAEVPLLFGRWLWDEDFALRPDMHKNLQLKVTWDEDAANTSVVVNALEVFAYVDDNPKAQAKGYLSNKIQNTYVMAASTHQYVDLPVDKPLRRVFARVYSALNSSIDLLTRINLELNGGAKKLLEMTANQIRSHMRTNYPRIVETDALDAAVTAKTLYVPVADDQNINISYDATAFVTAQSKFAVATWTGQKLALSASVDIKANNALISGHLPHGVIDLPVCDTDVVEDFVRLSATDALRLDIESSSSAASPDFCEVITQQAINY